MLPAATEMVCALGASELLVGRSHECDFPPEIRKLPACTESKINTGNTASSAEINRQIKELQNGTQPEGDKSLYRLDAPKIKELQPDIIITQGQCDVCAVSLREVEEMIGNWPGNRPEILSLAPARMAEIWDGIRRVANALNIEEHGREVLRALKNRVVSIIEKTCVVTKRPSVACIEWIEPLMAAGNWVPELVELVGGANVLDQAGKHSAWMDGEALLKVDPEIIVLMPCGFDLNRVRSEATALVRHPVWTKLEAVKKKRVYLTDGNAYFNRPGPRIVESLEILAEIIWPEKFKFGHKGWELMRS
ncbi:MAG TPA: cobalamin-binding protein [Verrucomicrobiae bacterium]|nr:cobalamin-binding protein [Verrucomicrobiae bacterium]